MLYDLLDAIAARGRGLFGLGGADATDVDLATLGRELLSRRGEASGIALAQRLLADFAHAEPEARAAFLEALAVDFGADAEAVEAAIAAYREAPGAETLDRVHEAAEPRRQELMRRMNTAPGGTEALIRMREAVMDALPDNPRLAPVDADFVHLFSSWFNRGFLMLRPIDWNTPASILEKLIRYEAVHAINGWDDLKNRLGPPDRRCYGFFHPRLPDDPLIFVEVALTRDIPDRIAPILDMDRVPIAPEDATTAVFYSISNTQRGLAGVSFGHFLIKQVVEELRREVPGLRTFVTLSPVPRFARWLAEQRTADEPDLEPAILEALDVLDAPGWQDDADVVEALREPFLAAAAFYFLEARDRLGRVPDPIARFHLGNGARLEQLDMLGDVSAKGMAQAHGLMVNYLYDPQTIEANHEAFAERGEVIASQPVRKA
ncbi:MAG: malonyl-CoA decarboxylase, partial [Rhizobiales bacterium]|nr:malonyl-CoA decarboxylase [Hyphomicrobiales bacterium]